MAQPPCDNTTGHKEILRTQRLSSYLDDPISYGSRIVAMCDRPVPTSHDNISREAESKMAVKITGIMKPFKNNEEHRRASL